MNQKESTKTNDTIFDPSHIPLEKQTEIKKYFPSFFSDDKEERIEEADSNISDLKALIEEHKEDLNVINYIGARSILMRE